MAEQESSTTDSESTTNRNELLEEHQEQLVIFGKFESDRFIIQVVVDPDEYLKIPTEVYHTLSSIAAPFCLPISEVSFIRMMRALLMQRILDIVEIQTYRRPRNVRPLRNIDIPAPIADFLYSLGMFESKCTGVIFTVIPPARHPQYWNVSQKTILQYLQTMNVTRSRYKYCPFPGKSNHEGSPVLVTALQEANGYGQVKSYTNEPDALDVFLRFVNDANIFITPFTYNKCHLLRSSILDIHPFRSGYVRSYIRSWI